MKATRLKPLFWYFGSKWKLAPLYPQPRYGKIVEAFAGSACYALLYPGLDVDLYEINPAIAMIWRYLIRARESEIRALPVAVGHCDAISVCEEAKQLIRCYLAYGRGSVGDTTTISPSKTITREAGAGWNATKRDRIADQLKYIRHWRLIEGSYEGAPNEAVTWFVDPPYIDAGVGYTYHDIDYPVLGEWCKERRGQVMVCEQDGATWLPFRPFATVQAAGHKSAGVVVSKEVIWTN